MYFRPTSPVFGPSSTMKSKQTLPLALLQETYRPLTFFASEMLLAAAPFLPRVAVDWARRIKGEQTRGETA